MGFANSFNDVWSKCFCTQVWKPYANWNKVDGSSHAAHTQSHLRSGSDVSFTLPSTPAPSGLLPSPTVTAALLPARQPGHVGGGGIPSSAASCTTGAWVVVQKGQGHFTPATFLFIPVKTQTRRVSGWADWGSWNELLHSCNMLK